MKFRTKLTILLLTIVVFTGVVISYAVYTTNLKTLEKEITHKLEDIAFHVMDKIDRTLYERYVDIKCIANDIVISSRNSTPEEITERLIKFRNMSRTYVSLSFFDLNGIIIADTSGMYIGKEHPMAFNMEDVFQGKENVASDLMMAEGLKVPVVYFASPIKDKNGGIFGVVVAGMPISKIHYITREASGIHKKEDIELLIDLIDRDGLLLFSSYNKKGILKDRYADYELVKKSLIGNKIGSFINFHFQTKDEYIFTFVLEQGYLDFKGNGWILLLHVPERAAFASAYELRNNILIVLLPIIAISFLVVIFFSRMISRPIIKLRDAAVEVGRGNLNAELDVKSKDEIGQLTTSFNEMIKDLGKTTVSRDFMDNIIRSMTDILIVTTPDGIILTVNNTICNLLGYQKYELIGQPIGNIFEEELSKETIFDKLVKMDFASNVESTILSKDHTRIPILFSSSVMREHCSEIKGFICTARDITKLKQVENALRKKNSFLKLLQVAAMAANEAREIKDAFQPVLDEICLYKDWPIGHAYMISEDDPNLLEPTEVWHLKDVKKFAKFCNFTELTKFAIGIGLPGRVLESSKPHWIIDVTKDSNFIRTNVAKDLNIKLGVAFPVMVRTKVEAVLEFFSTEALEPDLPFLEIMADIGTQLGRIIERKRIEEERQQLLIKMMAASKLASLGEISTGIAHEINQPLTYISSFIQRNRNNLEEDNLNKNILNDELKTSYTQVNRIVNIIDHLRTFGRRDDVEKHQISIENVYDNSLLLMGERIRLKNIKLTRNIEPDLPLISGSSNQLEQVFINLFQNAIDAFSVKPNDAEIDVKMFLSENKGSVIIKVRDNGIGIEKEKSNKIFEPFFTTKEVEKGTGLGLSIVYGIVQEHNGSILCESKPNKGTMFTIKLPVTNDAQGKMKF